MLVTPDFDVQPTLLAEYYVHLDQRLIELQNLLGSQGAVLPSTYEKYLHGNVPAGTSGNPLVSAKEYYEQLKQLRADSQVRQVSRWSARHVPGAWSLSTRPRLWRASRCSPLPGSNHAETPAVLVLSCMLLTLLANAMAAPISRRLALVCARC